MMALNVELETNDGSERQIGDVALNTKCKRDMMALNVELRTNENSERQNGDVTLNAKLEMWL